ncbi:MAG: NAD(P)-dependent glycerol-3-phosphate dehydrogenase [Bdellovibrionales bacterium]|nr:NAD(P)-dependent glycerol-3-phosphate dehydrogenase [Bdellovibrionales bacterium]
MSSPQIGVLGLGNFGTALAHHLGSIGNQVVAWDRDTAVIDELLTSGRHPKVFSDVTISENVRFEANLEALAETPTLLVAIAASALENFLPTIAHFNTKLVISAVKGFATEHETPLSLLNRILPADVQTAVLSGPGFARDLIHGTPIGIVAGSKDEAIAKQVAQMFSGGSLRVYASADPLGVELGGILKNVVAIAVGISDGYGFGDSARAFLITRGLSEMIRIATHLGATEKTLFGLSGLGDLVLTATCDASRNRSLGLALGKGNKLEQALEQIGSTTEGVRTARLLVDLANENAIEMPIIACLVEILDGKIDPKETLKKLLSRNLKTEF